MKFRLGFLVFCSLMFCFLTMWPLRAATVAPAARLMCELQDARIDESSGLVASRKYADQNLLWTHNDSDKPAQLFLFDTQGETIATIDVEGAVNTDWEDIALSGNFLYIGDIGDNLHRRESLSIYRLPEPSLDSQQKNQSLKSSCEKMILKYPDGARDAETLLATRAGELILVSKNGGASRFYKTPKPFQNGATQTLELIGEYAFTGKNARSMLATGGDISADESRFVVRTYTHAIEWIIPAGGDWKTILQKTPRAWLLPESKQGEAICYAADGTEYFVSSEGAPAPVWEIEFAPVF